MRRTSKSTHMRPSPIDHTCMKKLTTGMRVRLSDDGRQMFSVHRGSTKDLRYATVVTPPYVSYAGAFVMKVIKDGNKYSETLAVGLYEPLTDEERCFL